MKPRSIVVALLVLAVAAVCVRLGFWQISRLHEKQALNAALRRAIALPAIPLDPAAPPDSARGRRLEARGHYDQRFHVLLGGRTHDGAPGVAVVTPLVLAGDSIAVLIERGWVYAADAMTARPDEFREPGERTVIGIADTLRHGRGGPSTRVISADSMRLYSTRWLDADSLAGRFPFLLVPLVIRQLPGPGGPTRPLRLPPRPYDEFMHVSYAIQWFMFATILLVGSLVLARQRRRGGGGLREELGPDAP